MNGNYEKMNESMLFISDLSPDVSLFKESVIFGKLFTGMRRIAVFLQLLFYSFIFIPVAHSVAPLSVVEFDNIYELDPSVFSLSYIVGLAGLFCVLLYLDHDRAYVIDLCSSILLFVPIVQYINWHNFWIPMVTAVPFILITISAILQLR